MKASALIRFASDSIATVVVFGLLYLISYLLKLLSILPPTRQTTILSIIISLPVSIIAVLYISPVYRKYLLYSAFLIFTIETLLQLSAFLGILPGVSFFNSIPYGRVYWTKEGFSNSRMNRYGWHYPTPELNPESEKIVIIGDSFIQANQVSPQDNIGMKCQQLLNEIAPTAQRKEVLSIGINGCGPAQYLEILKHADKHFGIDQAVIFIFVGNDFRNVCYELYSDQSPESYFYYEFDENDRFVLHPQSGSGYEKFNNKMNENYNLSSYILVKSLYSNIMIPQVIRSIVSSWQVMKRQKRTRRMLAKNPEQNRIPYLGKENFIFRTSISQDAKTAFKITSEILKTCQDYAAGKQIELLLATIPVFPSEFYQDRDPDRSDWNLRFDEFDFLLPEKLLTEFAATNGIDFLGMGRYLQEHAYSPDDIMQLYFLEGRGHWSERGHEVFSRAVCERLAERDGG